MNSVDEKEDAIIEILGGKKITCRARRLVTKSLWAERISFIDAMDYKLFVHSSAFRRNWGGVFTIILTVHGDNIKYFQKAIESALIQTIENIELILVDHGCQSGLRDLIYEYFKSDSRIKLIKFEKNLCDWKVQNLVYDAVFNVINSALFCSEGDFFFFLSFDDFLSENYVEAMLRLFVENPDCVVASPAVVSINEFSDVNSKRTKDLLCSNKRNTYVSGISLATSVIQGGDNFAAPGGLFSYRTDLVLNNGGLDCMNDLSQVFKFAVLGSVGTNFNATLFWRHHDTQTNKLNAKSGALYYRVHTDWLTHIRDIYSSHSIPLAYQRDFFRYMERKVKKDMLFNIQTSIRSGLFGSVKIIGSILNEAPKYYLLYFIASFMKNLPYVIYSCLPQRFKDWYRYYRDLLLK
jgi:glycosyltransferase involved in cell wall biosynthesis